MSDELKEKLKKLLRKLFQFDCEDLDFGIYRIMNFKRKEIEKFINERLIDEVKKQLHSLSEEEKSQVMKEFEK